MENFAHYVYFVAKIFQYVLVFWSNSCPNIIRINCFHPVSAKVTKKAGRPARKGRKPGPKPKPKPAAEQEIKKPKQEDADEPAEDPPPVQAKAADAEPKPDTRRKKRSLMGLDMAEVATIQSAIDSEPQVRQSRRIAQIKIREEADRRKAEEVALHKMKEASEKKKKNLVASPKSESDEENSESEAKLEKKKRRKKGNKERPWQTDSDDDPEDREEDDMDDHEHEHEERLPPLGSDHEFSPESDIEDVPTKRARTARKDKTDKKEEDSDEAEDVHACQKCGKNDHPEWILLCDKCDKGYHCSCLIPVLFVIPEGNWFCPMCQQDQLIGELVSKLDEFDARVRQKEAEEAQRQRTLLNSINEANVLRDTKRDRQRARAAERGESDESSDYSSSDESDAADERKRDRGADREKRREARQSRPRKRDDSTEQSSDSDNTSDDEPIYKFRKRRQANVSYRFNEYDELINRAIKSDMDEVAGAGNLGRGKDIATIIEADKEKKRRQQMGQAKEERGAKGATAADDDDDDSDDEPLSKQKPAKSDGSDSEPLMTKRSKNAGRKKKKLNSLDSDTSEDVDQSDDDFKASVTSSSNSDEEASVDSDSSSDSLYKKKKKKAGRMSTRRSGRERKKRYDADFIDDDSFDDDDDIPLVKKKKKKVESDYSDELNDSSDEELEEDVDSDDLCDDSTDDSDKAWSRSKKKSKPKPKPTGGKVPRKPIAKAKKPKKKPKSSDAESDYSNEVLPKSRRTRGKKLPYLLDDDFDSSDDGIRPGVKRPDTPPEEREAFIKKQEEIKRMLAEKKNDDHSLLPKENDSLSTIPKQIIQSAKALDIDLKKSAILQKAGSDNDSTAFDDDLPEDFDPEEMDEDAIAKMMEEEEFAQQQLKLAGETIRSKKQKDPLPETPKKDDKMGLDIGSSVIMANISPALVSPLPFGQSLTIPDIPASMYAAQTQASSIKTTPKKRGRKKEDMPHMPEMPKAPQNLADQFGMMKDQPLAPPLSTIQHTSVLPPAPKPSVPLNIPSILAHGVPPRHLYPPSAIQHTSSVIAHSSALPPQRSPLPPMPQTSAAILGMAGQKPLMPPTLLDVQSTRLMNPVELSKPPDDLFESPTKKRGRRKKITPLRESLQPASAVPSVSVTANITHQPPITMTSVSKPPTSILSERLTGNPGKSRLLHNFWQLCSPANWNVHFFAL